MLLGFVSLLLAALQNPVSKIYISPDLADTMLPCRKEADIKTTNKVVLAYMNALNLSSFDPLHSELPSHATRHLEEQEDATVGTTESNNKTTATADSDHGSSKVWMITETPTATDHGFYKYCYHPPHQHPVAIDRLLLVWK